MMFYNKVELDTEAILDALEVARCELIRQRHLAERRIIKAKSKSTQLNLKETILDRFSRLNRICKVQEAINETSRPVQKV